MNSSDTPVLLIIFNRPDKVRSLVDSMSAVKPRKIYITADGPRSGKEADVKLCEEARAVATAIPWECKINTNFSQANKGCKLGVSTGIDWFFTNETEGIILEDDCIPDISFFPFCSEMLDKYHNENAVMHINGTSFLPATKESNADYYFSHISHSWGWATWKRAWEHFDVDMEELPQLIEKIQPKSLFIDVRHMRFWVKLFNHIKKTGTDSWANPWSYSILNNGGICITPNVNLIKNIGFDAEASNTTSSPKFIRQVQSLESSQMKHPAEIVVNKRNDQVVMNNVYIRRPMQRAISLLKKWYYLAKQRVI